MEGMTKNIYRVDTINKKKKHQKGIEIRDLIRGGIDSGNLWLISQGRRSCEESGLMDR